jgi:DNA-binding NtrC family response regulator
VEALQPSDRDSLSAYRAALTRSAGNLAATARILGVSLQTVRSRLEKYPELAEHRRRVRS